MNLEYSQENFCGDDRINWNVTGLEPKNDTEYGKVTHADPAFQAWWVARYCTYNGKNKEEKDAVHPFISFYPYIILGLGISLFSIDKIVEILFNATEKLDKFHKVLVENKILNDTEVHENSEADGSLQEIELRYAFRKNQNYYTSFVLRSALQIVLASGFLFFITIRGIEITYQDADIYCKVHGYWHECHGIPMSRKKLQEFPNPTYYVF